MRKALYTIMVVLAGLLWQSCRDDSHDSQAKNYTVAVVVPLSGETASQWRSTVDWAVSNIDKAQLGNSHSIHLNVEFFNEDKEDIKQLGSELAEREDVVAVIGPVDQQKLNDMAAVLRSSGKPMMAIWAGSTDVVRKYVEKKNFFWAMTQTDISQCEVMISTAAQSGRRQFTLICNDENITTQTFKDWFPFQVTELGLNIHGNLMYTDAGEIKSLMHEAINSEHGDTEAIICVPANEQEARIMLEEADRLLSEIPEDKHPLMYFSNNVVQMPLHDMNLGFNFYSVYPFVDPQSGFYTAFYAHTGKTGFTFEAQLYDALMITAMGLAYNPEDLKASMIEITGNQGPELRAWNIESMSQIFHEIENGGLKHHVTGASSSLRMDTDNHTCVTSSHFMLSYCSSGNFFPIAYYSTQGAGQSQETLSDWNWQVTNVPDIETTNKTFTYPALHDRWAVVVAGSTGFTNYRHQADALNVYQFLRASGYNDDHILMVMADDIANNPQNTRPGMISISPDGPDVYNNAVIDYKLADLTLQQLLDKIIEMPCDADDNLLVFWTGHGSPNGLGYSREHCTPDMVKCLMDSLQGRYRKMMWLVEACYSGVIGKAIEGYPGAIAMTAANDNETSKASVYNSDMNIWMSNRFTEYLIETQKVSPLTIREIYYYICVHTLGSHPSLYNAANFDDITKAGLGEFLGVR